MFNKSTMLKSKVKLLPTMLNRLENIPTSTCIMNNVFRSTLDNYEGDDFNLISHKMPYHDNYVTLKSFDHFRVMLGVLPPKESTYYHLNRHIKILDGNVEVRFNNTECDKFKFDKNYALTIASPHYLFNNNKDKTSTYIWIEKTPAYQNSLII